MSSPSASPTLAAVNDEVLDHSVDQFLQIVSCNTHNITTLVKTLAETDGKYDLDAAQFVCIRRANDITQADKFIPSPQVGSHDDPEFGTHHARDAHHLFKTQGLDLDIHSSAVKVNTQYMHSIWFHIRLNNDVTLDEVKQRLYDNPRVAVTQKKDANLIFSFGRDHGYYGRIMSQTVVVLPTLHVRRGRDVYGFCFTPQDGNSLLSSIAATALADGSRLGSRAEAPRSGSPSDVPGNLGSLLSRDRPAALAGRSRERCSSRRQTNTTGRATLRR